MVATNYNFIKTSQSFLSKLILDIYADIKINVQKNILQANRSFRVSSNRFKIPFDTDNWTCSNQDIDALTF